ncbi:MAG: SpoIIE family protein phosphatase [Deltaproteobacteria bacterium]|nr:SpoIIE family protein phosphatase [Deltaproteobacteria bacterium]MCW5806047.1 SpoIIE family protein phosphatase [Deltaproteobacteria bacterium]
MRQAFPFHIAFRADGSIVQCGPVIERLCPELCVHLLPDVFRIERPASLPLDIAVIRQYPRTVFVLEALALPLKLKGQMLYVEDEELMLFLGSPWIHDLATLGDLGIELNDFAVHDQVVDCLFLIQSQQAALSDVRKLASQQSVKLAQQQAALLEVEKLARERLEKELELARQIQVGILPRSLIADGFELAATMTTATEVGGDYYDVLPVHGGCWIGIGDVSGHGVTSGLIMLMVQSVISALVAMDPTASPRDAVTVLNRVLFENIRHRLIKDDFVTLSLLRAQDRRVVFAGAHEHFLVSRARTGTTEPVATPGTWLGVLPDVARFTTETTIELEPDDVVVLYTDGITEARNAAGEQFGLERLGEAVQRHRHGKLEDLRDGVLDDVGRWAARRDDDATLVLLRRAN